MSRTGAVGTSATLGGRRDEDTYIAALAKEEEAKYRRVRTRFARVG